MWRLISSASKPGGTSPRFASSPLAFRSRAPEWPIRSWLEPARPAFSNPIAAELISSRSSRRMNSPVASTHECFAEEFYIIGRIRKEEYPPLPAILPPVPNVSNRHSRCTSSRVCNSIPGSTPARYPWRLPSLRNICPWHMSGDGNQVEAKLKRLLPRSAGGIISTPAHGEKYRMTCSSGDRFS